MNNHWYVKDDFRVDMQEVVLVGVRSYLYPAGYDVETNLRKVKTVTELNLVLRNCKTPIAIEIAKEDADSFLKAFDTWRSGLT